MTAGIGMQTTAFTSVPRWNHSASFEHSFDCDASMHASAEGPFVTYADHVEALRQATALATPETVEQANYWYEQGQRDVFALHAEWTVAGMCKPDCLPCQRLTELIVERSKGYDEGQREALDAAVQRIKALPWTSETWLAHAERAAIIAAIKGDQP